MEAKHLDFVNIKFGVSDFRVLREFLKEETNIDIENYSFAFLRRRVSHILHELKLQTTSDLIKRLKKYPTEQSSFLQMLEVPVTEFFRDPFFWRGLSHAIQQRCKSTTAITIWVPNTASGEELFSLLILIEKLQLTDKVHVTASNINSIGINKAKEGVLAIANYEQSERNFFSVFNENKFNLYVNKVNGIDKRLLTGISFETLDYTQEFETKSMDIILFRNTLLYYNSYLANQILNQFHISLKKDGILCLGAMEQIEISYSKKQYSEFDKKLSMYTKD